MWRRKRECTQCLEIVLSAISMHGGAFPAPVLARSVLPSAVCEKHPSQPHTQPEHHEQFRRACADYHTSIMAIRYGSNLGYTYMENH